MEMNTKENERLIKNLQLEVRKEAAVSRRIISSHSVTLRLHLLCVHILVAQTMTYAVELAAACLVHKSNRSHVLTP